MSLLEVSKRGTLQEQQAVQGLQAFAFCVVNVDSTLVSKHFEDLKNLIILNILYGITSWALFTVKFYKPCQIALFK